MVVFTKGETIMFIGVHSPVDLNQGQGRSAYSPLPSPQGHWAMSKHIFFNFLFCLGYS